MSQHRKRVAQLKVDAQLAESQHTQQLQYAKVLGLGVH